MAYKQNNNPFAITSCGRRRSYMMTDNPAPFKQKEKEAFEAHDMYDKQKAETKKEHLQLKDKGYSHAPLKRCWKGYKPNPDGRPAEESGSCVKDTPAKQTNKKTKGKGRHFRTPGEGAGMTAKGVASYKKQNPGSKLKTAVTGKVKAGSKDAKRRGAFCARSKSWTSERGKATRVRWKC